MTGYQQSHSSQHAIISLSFICFHKEFLKKSLKPRYPNFPDPGGQISELVCTADRQVAWKSSFRNNSDHMTLICRDMLGAQLHAHSLPEAMEG